MDKGRFFNSVFCVQGLLKKTSDFGGSAETEDRAFQPDFALEH